MTGNRLYTSPTLKAERNATIAAHGVAYVEYDVFGAAIRVSPYHPGSWLCRIVKWTAKGGEVIN